MANFPLPVFPASSFQDSAILKSQLSKSKLLSAILSERGRCKASLKSSVSKLKGVTKKCPECPHTKFCISRLKNDSFANSNSKHLNKPK